jgi:peptide/nickel transport system substrate-binding protein
MSFHTFKLRFRRTRRKQLARVLQLVVGTNEQLDKNFLGRLGKFRIIWKFLLVWTLLFLLVAGGLVVQLAELKKYYQVLRPTPGGMYAEGIEGTFTTANPLYAVNDVDTSVSQLLFAGLLTYNDHNQLTGNLADRWSANANGTVYTVHLRPNLRWHDGRPLTAADVVFTYQTIQNPDAQSPLLPSWQGVTVAAVDNRTITFSLPNPLSSFPYSLTNGIVPKHILQVLDVADLRSAAFNASAPVGAGPFVWSSVGVSGTNENAEEQIILRPFAGYWAGAPRLDSFSIHAYANRPAMLAAYHRKEITAMAGLDQVPAGIAREKSPHVYDLPLTAGTFVFFKTTDPVLKDARVRQALVAGADRSAIIARLGYPALSVDGPLLKGQLGYDPAYTQVTNHPDQAGKLLDAAGWQMGAKGVRMKNGQPLTFFLSVAQDTEYMPVARHLRDQWKLLGVDVQLQPLQPDAFQSGLARHSYQAVLYGISIGSDPDVFVYWDSTQANVLSPNRLNFSEYSSPVADAALEAGRTRLDNQLRAIKYRSFLQAWQKDAPALGLYQPRLLYISHVQVYGLGTNQINTDADRFDNVQNWMIHLNWVTP